MKIQELLIEETQESSRDIVSQINNAILSNIEYNPSLEPDEQDISIDNYAGNFTLLPDTFSVAFYASSGKGMDLTKMYDDDDGDDELKKKLQSRVLSKGTPTQRAVMSILKSAEKASPSFIGFLGPGHALKSRDALQTLKDLKAGELKAGHYTLFFDNSKGQIAKK